MIRRATVADHDWIRTVAADVYRELGDYRTIIGSWLDHPGSMAYVEERGELLGFILLGFYYPVGEGGICVADLLAIAVVPPHQRKGLGRALLDHAIHLAGFAGQSRGVAELRLTVADSNAVGQRLFAGAGFRVIDDLHGRYDGGQRAIRMARPLDVARPRAVPP